MLGVGDMHVLAAKQPALLPRMEVPPHRGVDASEREAARVADRVDARVSWGRFRATAAPGGSPHKHAAPPSVRSALSAPGHALDRQTRQFAESRLGHDFGAVRIHTDPKADESARALDALAYAYGEHVVFAVGAFSPSTREGRRLIVHELAHVVQQRGTQAIVQRQPAPPVRTATVADRREFVRLTVDFLNSSAAFFSDPLARIDAARFERLIDSWYLMVVERERMIDSDLGGDAALKAQLRAAYASAIRVLISRAAAAFGRTEQELFRANSGRIPAWALPTPSRLEAGISTPIPERAPIDVTTGAATFSTNGFDVTIAPDTTAAALGSSAETRIDISWGRVHHDWEQHGRHARRITRFDGPGRPTVRIQTFFGPRATASDPSGYGRGTTPEDVAGGRVTARSTTLGLHEGSHGLAYLSFLQSNPPPRFTGAVGMAESEFVAARRAWEAEGRDYVRRIRRFSEASVDCVGITIDEFHRTHARRGATIRLVCRR